MQAAWLLGLTSVRACSVAVLTAGHTPREDEWMENVTVYGAPGAEMAQETPTLSNGINEQRADKILCNQCQKCFVCQCSHIPDTHHRSGLGNNAWICPA